MLLKTNPYVKSYDEQTKCKYIDKKVVRHNNDNLSDFCYSDESDESDEE